MKLEEKKEAVTRRVEMAMVMNLESALESGMDLDEAVSAIHKGYSNFMDGVIKVTRAGIINIKMKKGMSIEEIANSLDMAPVEVRDLIKESEGK